MNAQTLAREATALFSLPNVAIRASAAMDAPGGSAQDLVDIIETDVGLTATVLRLANSVLFNHFGKVESLNHAVAIVGHKALRDLVLASSAVNTFKGIPAEFVDMETFWDNSITCGVLSQQIARRLRMPEAEAMFVYGLLHGVGRLVFYSRRPGDYRVALSYAHSGERELTAAERDVFGFTYAQLGAALLSAWDLPQRLCTAIEYQLNPEEAPVFKKEAAIVHLANEITANLAPCIKTQDQPEPNSKSTLLYAAKLGLDEAALEEIRTATLAASLEIIEIIYPNPTMY